MSKKKIEKKDDLLRVEKGLNKKGLSLSLPIPPSVNHMYYNTRGGGRRLTPAAEAWIKLARRLCIEAIEKCNWKMEMKGKWLVCEMEFYFPDKRKRDNHNSFKCLFDALEGLVYENDMYVLPQVLYCGLDKEYPRIDVRFLP